MTRIAPTRMGLHGTAFTPEGTLIVKNAPHKLDRRPLVEGCACPACARYDRAFLRHLVVSREELGLRLIALHNVTFLLDVMRGVRAALAAGTFASWAAAWLSRYRAGG